jgi:hypothetical protein
MWLGPSKTRWKCIALARRFTFFETTGFRESNRYRATGTVRKTERVRYQDALLSQYVRQINQAVAMELCGKQNNMRITRLGP